MQVETLEFKLHLDNKLLIRSLPKFVTSQTVKYLCLYKKLIECNANSFIGPGACPGFLKGGGGPISLGSLKKRSSDFKRGGVKWSDGGVQYISLPKMTNLAYLDAKE